MDFGFKNIKTKDLIDCGADEIDGGGIGVDF
jgi:hypothetical protein